MIDIANLTQSPIIELTVNGKMTEEDVDKADAVFKQKITEQEPINLLLNAEELDGITIKGLFEDIKMAKYLKSMSKAAIVSDKEWLKADAKLENLFPGIEVRYFTPDSKNEAISWLKN